MRLVALDPVSGFFLVEQVAETRTVVTWTQALAQWLAGLNVRVVQGTSDEAKGLLARFSAAIPASRAATAIFHSTSTAITA